MEEGFEALPRLRDYIRFDGQNLAVPVFDKVRLSSLDLILCRNVIIYFDRDTQATLFDRFSRLLRRDGHLVIGHSETLNWLSSSTAQRRSASCIAESVMWGGRDTPPCYLPPAQAISSECGS